MITKTINLGHQDGSHKNLSVTIKVSSRASFSQEFTITDQHGDVIYAHEGNFDRLEEHLVFEDARHLYLAIGVSHSHGKDHTDVRVESNGPWKYTISCEDGVDNDYNDLIIDISAEPKGFR